MTPLGGWLAFTLYVGAAVADATPSQAEELRLRIRPLLHDLKQHAEAGTLILAEVGAVMGPDWHPTGTWEQWLTTLITEEKE